MDTSLFLARLFGILYLVLGIAIIVNKDRYQSLFRNMLQSGIYLFVAGVISLLVGITLVSVHSIWVADWRILITMIGWIACIKGTLLLVSPATVVNVSSKQLERIQQTGMGVFILGLVLTYFAFIG